MLRFDIFRFCEVRNCPRDLEYSVVRTRRQIKSVHSIFQQLSTLFIEGTIFLYQLRCHLSIRVNVGNIGESLGLNLTRSCHSRSHLAAPLPCVFLCQLLKRHWHHLHMKVYPVEQRTRYPIKIFLHRTRLTRTLLCRMIVITARTRVHCSYQHEVSRKLYSLFRPCYGDESVFHRLSQHLQDVTFKLRELIEK